MRDSNNILQDIRTKVLLRGKRDQCGSLTLSGVAKGLNNLSPRASLANYLYGF
jgi:hypothetical protein